MVRGYSLGALALVGVMIAQIGSACDVDLLLAIGEVISLPAGVASTVFLFSMRMDFPESNPGTERGFKRAVRIAAGSIWAGATGLACGCESAILIWLRFAF